MNSAERQRVRAAIDARVRLVAADAEPEIGTGRCKSCGCLWEERSAGCKVCRDRHRNYRQRRNGVSSHGVGGYTRGCRCDVCRGADRARRARLRDRRRAEAA